MALGIRGGRDSLWDVGGSHRGSLDDRIRRGIDLPRPYGMQGCPRHKGGNPSVARGTEGVKMRVRGTEAETPFMTTVSRGSMARWPIADRERVKTGL